MNLLRIVPLLVLLLVGGCTKQEATPDIDPAQLKAAMADGADYLVRVTKPSGEFVYLESLEPGRTFKPVYNVLRHAGTMYSLADYYQYRPEPEVKDALVRSAKWLQKKYLKPIKGEENLLAIWALPSDLDGRGPLEIKLGGVGLGLVALTETEKIVPGTTSLATLRKLGNCIVWLQEEDGSFFSKYDPAKGGKLDKWDSLFYSGEAALGLAMLAELDPDPQWKVRWINAAMKAVGFLARSRQGIKDVPADHWVLIATARLWPLHTYSDQTVSREELLRHAVQICEVISNDDALRDVRTTPIATRLEGMLAALTFLPPEQQALRDHMQVEVEKGVAFLLKAQVKNGPLRGAVPRAYTAPETEPVDERADEVRIDYIQHTLSAWLEYARQQGIIDRRP